MSRTSNVRKMRPKDLPKRFTILKKSTTPVEKLNVDLKAELGKLSTEKEQAENKLKIAQERLKKKTEELNNLIGKPMDVVNRRRARRSQLESN